MNIEELADYLGVPDTTIGDWRVAGKGPCAGAPVPSFAEVRSQRRTRLACASSRELAGTRARAKHSKGVLNLALGLALRYEAIPRNPVVGTARLRRPPSTTMALNLTRVEANRQAVRTWRGGSGLPGPKPDGQLEAILEVMLGTSARIGEVLAIRKRDVDVTSSPATVRICGTLVSPTGKPTYRQDHPVRQSERIDPPTSVGAAQ